MSAEPNRYLRHFFGSYFHQDWDIDYGSTEEVVDAFVRREPQEAIDGAKKELREIIDDSCTEAEIEKILLDFGCEYYVDKSHSQPSIWIKQVLELLSG